MQRQSIQQSFASCIPGGWFHSHFNLQGAGTGSQKVKSVPSSWNLDIWGQSCSIPSYADFPHPLDTGATLTDGPWQ